MTAVTVMKRPNVKSRNVKLMGLDPHKKYRLFNEDGTAYVKGMNDEGVEQAYAGATLMNAGIQICETWGDYQSLLIHVKEA